MKESANPPALDAERLDNEEEREGGGNTWLYADGQGRELTWPTLRAAFYGGWDAARRERTAGGEDAYERALRDVEADAEHWKYTGHEAVIRASVENVRAARAAAEEGSES